MTELVRIVRCGWSLATSSGSTAAPRRARGPARRDRGSPPRRTSGRPPPAVGSPAPTATRVDGLVVGERLLEVVLRTHLDRLDRGRRGAVAGHHDHRGRRDRSRAAPAASPARRGPAARCRERRRPAARCGRARAPRSPLVVVSVRKPSSLEDLGQGGQDPRLVVDDQDQLVHSGQVSRGPAPPVKRSASPRPVPVRSRSRSRPRSRSRAFAQACS